MPQYELQRRVNGDQWTRDKSKEFFAKDDDDAHFIAVGIINRQRLYYEEVEIRIIKIIFEGSLRGLNYSVEDDDKYIKLRENIIASEVDAYVRNYTK